MAGRPDELNAIGILTATLIYEMLYTIGTGFDGFAFDRKHVEGVQLASDDKTTRGFTGRRPDAATRDRLPPGQHLVQDFPVLTAGATPKVSTAEWSLSVRNTIKPVIKWDWASFQQLPMTKFKKDIHCVTTWSKFDTKWEGVLIEDLLEAAGFTAPPPYVLAHSYDNYSTNLPTAELLNGKAMVALKYDGQPITRDHGGPARLLVPHLYFWKSAKWLKDLQFIDKDTAGFWELHGYHIFGDPWKEQRYSDD